MNLQIENERQLGVGQNLALGFQHLFAMFGATVLVPLLTGLDPAVALFTSGTGTLIFQFLTKGQVPAYLGSSFAFIAPIIAASAQYGLPYALGGGVAVGLVYVVVAMLIAKLGTNWVDRVLPPVVIGSVIIVIGLGLAGTAVDMAG
ncbi:MAG: uracil permease, partial [Firmicutes bacterium]|nr:uracil permease [Bacillota bacterium]